MQEEGKIKIGGLTGACCCCDDFTGGGVGEGGLSDEAYIHTGWAAAGRAEAYLSTCAARLHGLGGHWGVLQQTKRIYPTENYHY